MSRDTNNIQVFTSKWFAYSYVFLVLVEILDGVTTRIGLDLGLSEVGVYAKVVLVSYGFWGLMVWKYSIVFAVGALLFLFYLAVKKYAPRSVEVCKYYFDCWMLNCRFAFASGCGQ